MKNYRHSFVTVLIKWADTLAGLRVDIEDESIGLDLTQQGERAYSE
jgi:ammonia channel protein AmtB